jgi:hypothetical protein
MGAQDYDSLKKAFDAFSLRLAARKREFEDSGAFSTTHAAFTERLLKGHAAVEARLEAAVHQGAAWKSTSFELERDINALAGDFGHLEELFDAQSMRDA